MEYRPSGPVMAPATKAKVASASAFQRASPVASKASGRGPRRAGRCRRASSRSGGCSSRGPCCSGGSRRPGDRGCRRGPSRRRSGQGPSPAGSVEGFSTFDPGGKVAAVLVDQVKQVDRLGELGPFSGRAGSKPKPPNSGSNCPARASRPTSFGQPRGPSGHAGGQTSGGARRRPGGRRRPGCRRPSRSPAAGRARRRRRP